MKERTRRRIAELEKKLAAVQRVDPDAWKTELEITAPEGTGTQPAPIAPAETLEALAEMAFRMYAESQISTTIWTDIVTAILRAARPKIDVSDEECMEEMLTIKKTMESPSSPKFRDWLQSRIRFNVELPESPIPAAPTDAQDSILTCGSTPSPVPTWRDPTKAELDSSLFNAIWDCIKTWDVNVPCQYNGYMSAIGNHVTLIMDAIQPHIGQRAVPSEAQLDAPTYAQIETLARALDESWETVVGGKYFTMWHQQTDPHRERRRAQARAAYSHIGSELAVVTAERDALRKERDQLAQNLIQRNLPDFYRLLKTTADAPPMEEVARQAECEDVELVAAVWQHASEYFEGKIKELALERDALRTEIAARATRPVSVRWSVAAEEVIADIGYGSELQLVESVMDYLAAHAVVDVPPSECQECAKWEKKYNDMLRWHDDLDAKLCAVRAALEDGA